MVLTNALKNFILDVAEVLDLHLSLFGELFFLRRYLSTHGQNVRVPRSVLCKIIAREDVIFNE